MPCADCFNRAKINDVLKSARQLDEWVGMQSIRHLTSTPPLAATFARKLFRLRTALRRLQ